MIHVVDAIMGSGKTTAAIAYMNSHPEQKFIYVTPFIEEAKRIVDACPALEFIEPRHEKRCRNSKVAHTLTLINEGKNVATTHQAFRLYTADIIDDVKKYGYTLILDECVDVLGQTEIRKEDLDLFVKAGKVVEEPEGHYHLIDDDYRGSMFSDMINIMRDRDVVRINGRNNSECYFWELPPRLFETFKDVYILTYMFQSSNLYYFFRMYDLPWKSVYVKHNNADYTFSDTEKYIPEYVYTIWDKVNILDNKRINEIGNVNTALSEAWYSRSDSDIDQLQNNLLNYFKMIKPVKTDERLWGTYSSAVEKIEANGYKKSFLAFNSRSTNKYSKTHVLAYCANVFFNVGRKIYYEQCGIDVDEDAYALSTLVQWVWRSAIRNGEEIDIYIPSKRMRTLFTVWLDSLESLNPDKNAAVERAEARAEKKKNQLTGQQLRWKKYHEQHGGKKSKVQKFGVNRPRTGGKQSKVNVPYHAPEDYLNIIDGGLIEYEY